MSADSSPSEQSVIKIFQISHVDIPEQFSFGSLDEIFEFIFQNPSYIQESYQILAIFFHLQPLLSSLILDLITKLSVFKPISTKFYFMVNNYPVLAFKLVENGVISEEEIS
jgi:hypothetical protein